MPVSLRHANRCRRGPSHHARHYRIGNTAFQQTGDCCMPKIVEPAPEWLRLFVFRFATQNRAGPLLGFLPRLLPIANGARRVPFVDDWAGGESKTTFIAGGTILLAREDKVRRLPIGKLRSPRLQNAKDSG